MNSGTVPPSTDQDAPDTSLARSEHRKTTTFAISSSVPNRPRGILPLWASSASSRVIPRASATWSANPPEPTHRDDSTAPGATAFTSTPSAAYVSAKTRDSDSCAALVTEYAAFVSDGRLPADDPTLTIRPPRASFIRG